MAAIPRGNDSDCVAQRVGAGDPAVLPHITAGKLKLLAVTGKERMTIASDIPTIAEPGYPGFEAVGWFGLAAPARTPRTIVNRLNADTVKAAQTPEAFARYIQSEVMKWRNLAKQMGLKPE